MAKNNRFEKRRHEIRCTVLPEVHDAVYLLASVAGKPASRVFSDMIQAGLRATAPMMSESDVMFSPLHREAATAELARRRAIAAIDSEQEVHLAAKRLEDVRREEAERRERASIEMEERRARDEQRAREAIAALPHNRNAEAARASRATALEGTAPTGPPTGAPVAPGEPPAGKYPLGEDPEAGARWREKYGAQQPAV